MMHVRSQQAKMTGGCHLLLSARHLSFVALYDKDWRFTGTPTSRSPDQSTEPVLSSILVG